MSELAKQLRSIRTERKLRLSEVAAEAGISVTYLSEIERGRRATVEAALATINKVLAVYDMEAVVEIRPIGVGGSVVPPA